MSQVVNFVCSPEEAKDSNFLEQRIRKELALDAQTQLEFRWRKRSIDARQRQIKVNASFDVAIITVLAPRFEHQEFKLLAPDAPVVHIIGAGPAGLFAALQAVTQGLKPIVFERGKDVRARRRDLAKLTKAHELNPESNYCFGEGGAGTYSDGKLYTRSKKRGDVQKVLEWLVQFGAKEDILIDAHPHIGTNKLPQLIEAIRQQIIDSGGEIHFEHKLTDLDISNGKIERIQINHSQQIPVAKLILATGHSARDIFELLQCKNIAIKAKPFALGVRVEHTQAYIDGLQYHGRLSDDYLPAASYSLVTQVDNRGVYSFCMCPGGIIAPCATADGEVVTNGWSPSKRNNIYANSGIVVGIEPSDFKNESDPFVCLDFQKEIEHKCWMAAGQTQKVPADFVNGRKSTSFPRSSYQPGIVSVQLKDIFPSFVYERLRQAFLDFDKKMPGFITNDAVVHAPESRTSSPVLIPRDPISFQHTQITNLYPIAEGAGYAGGIVSAAIDGLNCVEKIAQTLVNL
ncbi:MAG: FAD-binding protein [Flavobacteriia bacterium]|nr:MAG: FAD-binding protein [Flavobacteriia bacterium]